MIHKLLYIVFIVVFLFIVSIPRHTSALTVGPVEGTHDQFRIGATVDSPNVANVEMTLKLFIPRAEGFFASNWNPFSSGCVVEQLPFNTGSLQTPPIRSYDAPVQTFAPNRDTSATVAYIKFVATFAIPTDPAPDPAAPFRWAMVLSIVSPFTLPYTLSAVETSTTNEKTSKKVTGFTTVFAHPLSAEFISVSPSTLHLHLGPEFYPYLADPSLCRLLNLQLLYTSSVSGQAYIPPGSIEFLGFAADGSSTASPVSLVPTPSSGEHSFSLVQLPEVAQPVPTNAIVLAITLTGIDLTRPVLIGWRIIPTMAMAEPASARFFVPCLVPATPNTAHVSLAGLDIVKSTIPSLAGLHEVKYVFNINTAAWVGLDRTKPSSLFIHIGSPCVQRQDVYVTRCALPSDSPFFMKNVQLEHNFFDFELVIPPTHGTDPVEPGTNPDPTDPGTDPDPDSDPDPGTDTPAGPAQFTCYFGFSPLARQIRSHPDLLVDVAFPIVLVRGPAPDSPSANLIHTISFRPIDTTAIPEFPVTEHFFGVHPIRYGPDEDGTMPWAITFLSMAMFSPTFDPSNRLLFTPLASQSFPPPVTDHLTIYQWDPETKTAIQNEMPKGDDVGIFLNPDGVCIITLSFTATGAAKGKDFLILTSPNSPPTTGAANEIDLALIGSPAQTMLRLGSIRLTPTHLPSISLTTAHRNFGLAPHSPIISFLHIDPKPLYYPDDLAATHEDSLWRLYPAFTVYPGTVIELDLEPSEGLILDLVPTTTAQWLIVVSDARILDSISIVFSDSEPLTITERLSIPVVVKGTAIPSLTSLFFSQMTIRTRFQHPTVATKLPIPQPITFGSLRPRFILDVAGTGRPAAGIPLHLASHSPFPFQPHPTLLPRTSLISVSIPDPAPGVSYSVSLWAYPQNDNGSFFPVPDLVREVPPVVPTQETLLNITNIVRAYPRAFLRLSLLDAASKTTREQFDTVEFPIASACSTKTNLNDPQSPVIDNCPVEDQVCWPLIGACMELTGSGSSRLESCPQCNLDQTAACGTDKERPCQCKPGWAGFHCEQTSEDHAKCNAASAAPRCPVPNGSVLNINGSCQKQCSCFNNWGSARCNTCSMTCSFRGKPYNDCFRCGCNRGFTGNQCQCQGAVGTVVVSGTNPTVIGSGGRLTTSSALFSINQDRIGPSLPFPDDPPMSDIILFAILRELFIETRVPLTNDPRGTFGLTAQPTTDKLATRFTFTVNFACPDNPDLQTQFDVKTKWTRFLDGFIDTPALQKWFTAAEPSRPLAITSFNFEMVPATPPPEGEEYSPSNSASSFSVPPSLVFSTTFLLSLFMTSFLVSPIFQL